MCVLLLPSSYVFFLVSFRLKFVFGPCALQALDLVDQHSVTCLLSPSGRKAFQVCHTSVNSKPLQTVALLAQFIYYKLIVCILTLNHYHNIYILPQQNRLVKAT